MTKIRCTLSRVSARVRRIYNKHTRVRARFYYTFERYKNSPFSRAASKQEGFDPKHGGDQREDKQSGAEGSARRGGAAALFDFGLEAVRRDAALESPPRQVVQRQLVARVRHVGVVDHVRARRPALWAWVLLATQPVDHHQQQVRVRHSLCHHGSKI